MNASKKWSARRILLWVLGIAIAVIIANSIIASIEASYEVTGVPAETLTAQAQGSTRPTVSSPASNSGSQHRYPTGVSNPSSNSIPTGVSISPGLRFGIPVVILRITR